MGVACVSERRRMTATILETVRTQKLLLSIKACVCVVTMWPGFNGFYDGVYVCACDVNEGVE